MVCQKYSKLVSTLCWGGDNKKSLLQMILGTACLFKYLKDQRVYKSFLDCHALSVPPSPAMLVSDGIGRSDSNLEFGKIVRPTRG